MDHNFYLTYELFNKFLWMADYLERSSLNLITVLGEIQITESEKPKEFYRNILVGISDRAKKLRLEIINALESHLTLIEGRDFYHKRFDILQNDWNNFGQIAGSLIDEDYSVDPEGDLIKRSIRMN